MHQRTQRIAEEMKKILSLIIREQVKDPRIGDMVSVIRVELSRDLKYAKIFVSIFGDDKDKSNAMEGLLKAAGYIRKELATVLNIRYVPELQFKLDSSIDHSIAVAEILNNLAKQKQGDADDSI